MKSCFYLKIMKNIKIMNEIEIFNMLGVKMNHKELSIKK